MLTPGHSANAEPAAEAAVSLRVHRRICAFVVLLFILAASFSAMRKDVTQGFDELAHASYVAHLQKTGEVWPKFNDLRLLDPVSFRFTDELNYLNHAAPYYLLLSRLGPTLEGHPDAIVFHRLLNVALSAIGFAALMMIGLTARLPRLALYAYIVPLACIPVLVPLAGAINNDNMAVAGGGIATLAAWRLAATGSRTWLLLALGGVIIASGKLTSLLLVGGFVASVVAWTIWRGRFQARWIAPIVIAALIAGAPYIAFLVQYGSPAPKTTGQIETMRAGVEAIGWDKSPRMSLGGYAVHFVMEFIYEWMPSLERRNALNYAALAIPVAAIMCAIAGVAVSIRRIVRAQEGPIDVIVAAGAMTFAVTFTVHLLFGYQYHATLGWLPFAYPRYYLPLAALVPLAGLSLLSAVAQPRARATLIGFLIAGPVLFRLLGAPLG